MSFSSEIKQEIGTLNNLAKKDQIKFELLGYLVTSNCDVVKRARTEKLKFATESDYNINRYSKLLSNLKVEHDIQMSGNLFIIFSNAPELEELQFNEQGVIIKNAKKIYNESEENKRSIIRGMFLGSGSINNPQNKYHFEMSFSNKENLNFASNLINTFEIKHKKLITKDKFCIYIKEGEEISKILALIGANRAVMKFEDIRVEKEMRGKINRLVNCETANLTKTINASVEQIEAIEKLKREKRFSKLNDNLKEIAELRVKNPDLSLTDLGKLLNPPVGKSGVNYRLKRIIEIAND